MYTCKTCGEHFNKVQNLANHTKYTHVARHEKFFCKKCSSVFKYKSGLVSHEKFCDGIGTKESKYLKIKKPKNYICPTCGKIIRASHNLHVTACKRKHDQPKPASKGRSWAKGLTYEEIYGNRAEAFREKLSLSKKGKSTGRAETVEGELKRKRAISEGMKKSSGNIGGYRQKSGRGYKGIYKNIWCDSSWELAFVLYCLDNKIHFKRNTKKFSYIHENKTKFYIPDFILDDNTFIEVKGYITDEFIAKKQQFTGNLIVLAEKEMLPILTYVQEKYGKDFVKLYDKL